MLRALILVFVSGMSVMVSELVAGRIVAPCFGQSIRTWTALTGVTLLGCTLGNALGAILSRRSPQRVAGCAFVLGGASMMSVPFVLPLLSPLGLVPSVVLSWILPSVLLGCVTPSAAAAVVRFERNGSDLSLLYALSMAGSLLGSGLGGLFLPFVLPADTLYCILGVLLLAASPLAFSLAGGRSADLRERPEPTAVSDFEPKSFRPLCVSVFFVGYLGMAAEMAASKLIVPVLGGNHVVWALIIISFIGWMAVGGAIGGRLADRHPHPVVVVLALVLAALSISGTAVIETRVMTLPLLDALDVPSRHLVQIVVGLAPAAISLGAANTILLKFATSRALAAGDRAAPGLFYALSSAGAVAGTFVTGLWCTGLVPGHVLMGVLAVVTVLVAFVLVRSYPASEKWGGMMLASFALVGTIVLSSLARRPLSHDIVISEERPLFCRESNYNVVAITADPTYPTCRTIWLDRIGHTSVDHLRPQLLSATYTAMIDAILSVPVMKHESVFMIGGGGYALPVKWSLDEHPPKNLVVAEIDPVVKDMAFHYLKPENLKYPKDWQFPVGDGRIIAAGLEKGAYDVVIGDTIADTAIPYHLVTAEFTAQLKSLLKKDGVYLLHVLDVPAEQELAKTIAATLHRSFAHVGGLYYNGLTDKRQSIILVATDDPVKLDLEGFAAAVKRDRPMAYPHVVRYPDDPSRFVLTDRFAPVERWVWRTITSSRMNKAMRLGRQALDARNADEQEKSRSLALQSLDLDPDQIWAVEALTDWLEDNPSDAEALRRLEYAASRENPDSYAKKRLERFVKEHPTERNP